MTADPLAPRDVAAARGVEVGSIYRYLAVSRSRLRQELHLRPMDIPLPDASEPGQLPRWLPDGPIAAWIARTATSRKDTA
jgi:hypothetical protein